MNCGPRAVDSSPRRRSGAGPLVLWSLLALPATVPAAGSPRADLDALRSRVSEITARLRTEVSRQQAAEAELERVESALGQTTRTLLDLEGRQEALGAERAALRARAAALEQAAGEERRALGALVRSVFALARHRRRQLLLGPTAAARFGRATTYARYLHAHVAERIDGLARSAAALADLRREAAGRSERLADLVARAAEARTRLQAQREQRAHVLARLNLGIQSKRESLAAMRKDAERLTRLVAELEAALRASAPSPPEDRSESAGDRGTPPLSSPGGSAAERFPARRGRLPWPVAGRLTHRFGTPRGAQGLSWRGIVLEAPPGSVVRAVGDGRVAFADWLRGFGLLLIIDHGDGYMSLYGHNSTLLKQTGDRVDSAQAIGRIGDSGGMTESGLYFEIRKDGRPVDPQPWLARASAPDGLRVGARPSRQ